MGGPWGQKCMTITANGRGVVFYYDCGAPWHTAMRESYSIEVERCRDRYPMPITPSGGEDLLNMRCSKHTALACPPALTINQESHKGTTNTLITYSVVIVHIGPHWKEYG